MSLFQTANTLILSPRIFKFVNFAFFYLVWVLCVLGQGQFLAVIAILITMHFVLSPSKNTDAKVVFMLAGIGITVDILLTLFGVFVFNESFFPLWLVILWVAFCLTLNHCFSWLPRVPVFWQAILGAIGGASSYLAGYFLEAVDFTYSILFTGIIVAAVWSTLVPFFCYLIKKHVR
ncbi:DUF2878 domain-containing protein [Agarilytica rhodophyticola]|uniref:DUF2878 domain-containing protein n=1 Tax=Agarilytica rhodophyticola TaxID=1737490 RepID=UPI000B3446F5|nr:DUF2878 domain-containing protein [Agarilytica rhodophyticola]